MTNTRMDASFVNQLARTLSRFERQVIMLRYVEQLTPLEIGLVLHCESDRVFRTIADVQSRLRDALGGRTAPAPIAV